MIFELIGQEQITERFRRLNNSRRIGSAYLFTGPEGSGKTAVAMNIAAMFLCDDPVDGNACGHCPSCAKIRHLNHPNFFLIHALPRAKNPSDNDPYAGLSDEDMRIITEEEKALSRNPYYAMNIPRANSILISSMRDLKRKLAMGQVERGRQVILIHQLELATREAYSALLKVLEEPPRQATFILTAASADLLPPTIRSRCQTLRFNPVPNTVIVEYVLSRGRSEADAQRVARLSAGNVRQAKELLETDFSETDAMILDFWRIMMGSRINKRWVTAADMNELLERYAKTARENPHAFRNDLRFIVFWLRDAQLLSSRPGAKAELINPHFHHELRRFVEFYPDFPYFGMIRLVERTLNDAARNLYVPLLLADLFMEFRMQLLKTRKK
jgi:DNA polymerase-3 subunit delta'